MCIYSIYIIIKDLTPQKTHPEVSQKITNGLSSKVFKINNIQTAALRHRGVGWIGREGVRAADLSNRLKTLGKRLLTAWSDVVY